MGQNEELMSKIHHQNLAQKAHAEQNMPEVGIFWINGAKIIKYSSPVEDVVMDYDVKDVPVSHFLYWENLQGIHHPFKELEYDDLPRGRVLYHIPSLTYRIFGSKRTIKDEYRCKLILQSFKLVDQKIRFISDAHYELIS